MLNFYEIFKAKKLQRSKIEVSANWKERMEPNVYTDKIHPRFIQLREFLVIWLIIIFKLKSP